MFPSNVKTSANISGRINFISPDPGRSTFISPTGAPATVCQFLITPTIVPASIATLIAVAVNADFNTLFFSGYSKMILPNPTSAPHFAVANSKKLPTQLIIVYFVF